MRKISPQSISEGFLLQIAKLRHFHEAGLAAFTNQSDHSSLTEQSLLSAAVTWEGFVSDIFVAYINRDASVFKAYLQKQFEDHLKKNQMSRAVFGAFGTLNFPAHLKRQDVLSLANCGGANITCPTFQALESKAKLWLHGAHAAKFTGFSASQKQVINALVALRNEIAHRSERSLLSMNEALDHAALKGTGLQRQGNKVLKVGVWLKAKPVGCQKTRFQIILSTLEEIGRTF